MDIVYPRQLSKLQVQKSAYTSNGQKWVLSPAFTPPIHISPKHAADLEEKFIDLNADGKADLVYYKKISSKLYFNFSNIFKTF